MKRDIVIVGCAISAGVHGALTREHFREGAGAGGGFLVATILLGALAVVLTRRPDDSRLYLGTAVTLVGLLVSYALAVTTGVPLLHPEVEAVDGVALATKAIEAAALAAAVKSIDTKGTRTWTRHARTVPSLSR